MAEFIESYYDLNIKQQRELEAVLLGYEACRPGHHFGPVMRPYHLLHFITAGSGILRIKGREFSLQKGDVFYIPQDEIAYYQASATDPWIYYWCDFCGTGAGNIGEQFKMAAPEQFVLRGINTLRCAAEIQKAAELQKVSAAGFFYSNSVLLRVLSFLMEDIAERVEIPHVPTLAERIKYHLDLKYAENIRIRELAGHFGIHPNYLSQIFSEAFGISPKQYLTSLKLKKAALLLATTDMPVSAIANSLGFEDPLAFSKVFKKAYGVSPTQYKS
ncbi:MAG: AraC family transcriptional regulator [Lachnospiraceae bacterium]|nr:AraC family transcriptional regulator [Lachnospiraceae bacterium]